jgi:hypothetical protein
MELEELEGWAESFAAFCARFDDLFARSESRAQARQYLRGLLARLERKTTWQLAEVVKDGTPDRLQRLLYRVPWDVEAARDRLQQFIIERFADPEGSAVLDETGSPKKGTRSVGVHKHYCGALGKIENCQVATLLPYATERGQVLLDRRLFLPEAWCSSRTRRAKGKVPGHLPDQARAGTCHAGACLATGRADALGDGRFRLRRCAPPACQHPNAWLLVRPGAYLGGRVLALSAPAGAAPGADGRSPAAGSAAGQRRAESGHRGRSDRPSAARTVETAECGHRGEGAAHLRLGAGARDREPRWLPWPGGLAARAPLRE